MKTSNRLILFIIGVIFNSCSTQRLPYYFSWNNLKPKEIKGSAKTHNPRSDQVLELPNENVPESISDFPILAKGEILMTCTEAIPVIKNDRSLDEVNKKSGKSDSLSAKQGLYSKKERSRKSQSTEKDLLEKKEYFSKFRFVLDRLVLD